MIQVASFLEVFTSNFLFILTLIAIVIIVFVIASMVATIKTAGTKVRMAEMTLNRDRLNLMSKRILYDDLKNSAIMLNDEERAKIESIRQDNAILSRRSIVLMNEIEERMKRLELSTDTAKMFKIMGDIKKKENKLYEKS